MNYDLLFVHGLLVITHPKSGSCANGGLPVVPHVTRNSSFIGPDWLPFKSIRHLLVDHKWLHPRAHHFVLKSQAFAKRFFWLGQQRTHKYCSLLASDSGAASHYKARSFETNKWKIILAEFTRADKLTANLTGVQFYDNSVYWDCRHWLNYMYTLFCTWK